MSLARSCNYPNLSLHLAPPSAARIFLQDRINLYHLGVSHSSLVGALVLVSVAWVPSLRSEILKSYSILYHAHRKGSAED